MAFNKDHLSLMAVTGVMDVAGNATGVNFWFYHAHGENVKGANYFVEALGLGMTPNDLIYVPDGLGGVPIIGYVNAVGTITNVAFPTGTVTTT